MAADTGTIRLTVLADTAGGGEVPRTMTLAVTDVLSVHDAAAVERAATPKCEARVVLVEEVPGSAAWVFSDEDDDAPAPHRELLVAEGRRVVDLILGWARSRPQTFSAADVKAWDDWLDAGMPLERDIVAPPRAVFHKREAGPRKDGG